MGAKPVFLRCQSPPSHATSHGNPLCEAFEDRSQLSLHPLLQRRLPLHSTHRVIGDLALYKFTLIEFDDNKDAPTDQPTF